MCGICGKIYLDPEKIVSDEEIVCMRDEMIHRGPDDAGVYLNNNIGLGHRRLAIIDIHGSKQPMANEDGTVWIVFNGEIYNYQEIRRDLIKRGHAFKTDGDTETIVHLYEEYKEECVHKLNGMFAFAIWDNKAKKLFIARDRMGIKPVYYTMADDAFVFASEIKAILKHEKIRPEVNYAALGNYISFRHVYGDQTMFKGIFELLPGYSLTVSENRRMHISKYWDINLNRASKWCLSDATDHLATLMEDAIRMRMISDVPLGTFLSGGIDSSVIVALMSKLTERPIECFSIGFLPDEESELEYAAMVASHTDSHHNKYTVGDDDFFALIKKLIWHNDEPITFSASIPLYILSMKTKQKATVMLSGEGADELFAGYPQNLNAFRVSQFKKIIPSFLTNGLAHLPIQLNRLTNFFKRLNQSDSANIMTCFDIYPDLIKQDVSEHIPKNGNDNFITRITKELETGSNHFLSNLLYFQIKTYLCALLMKQDKMSMAASIETRVPFLDHNIVEFAFTLPDKLKIRKNSGKHILKHFAADKIPQQIIQRKKAGFPVPLRAWFQKQDNPFIETLLSKETREASFLNYDFLKATVDGYQRGDLNMEHKVWMLLNLELWRREFNI